MVRSTNHKRLGFLGKWMGMFLLLLSVSVLVRAQEVEFTATANPRVVELGERFMVSFSVNAQGENFVPPDFSSFAVLSGPNSSTSSSVQVINGKMTQSVSYSYNYILQGVKEGSFSISPASIEVKKKTYHTQEIQIEVVRGQGNSATAPAPQTPSSEMEGVDGQDLFVKVMLDRNEVYQGEALVATLKLFTRLDLSGLGKSELPSFSGFLQEEIDLQNKGGYLEREVVNGQVYGTLVLKQLVLIPQRSGTITIEPMELECLMRQRTGSGGRGFFDDFFDTYQTVSKTIQSDPVELKVNPLPPGAPASFNGLVGTYSFTASLDKTEVNANDALSLKVQAKGSGNLKLMAAPEIKFPPDFESYDPRATANISHSTRGSSGTKEFEYLLLPRSAGKYRIPSFEISYFDPGAKKYQVWRSKEFSVQVNPGESAGAGTVVTGFGKEDLQYIGKDIRYIKTGKIGLRPLGSSLLDHAWFYLAYLIVMLVFVLLFILGRRYFRMRQDTELMRNKKANAQARKRLKTARLVLQKKEMERFYEELSKACWGYLSDKLNIPVARLNRDILREELGRHDVSEELTGRYFEVLDHCELSRYAGTSEPTSPEDVYKQAVSLISQMEQTLK